MYGPKLFDSACQSTAPKTIMNDHCTKDKHNVMFIYHMAFWDVQVHCDMTVAVEMNKNINITF